MFAAFAETDALSHLLRVFKGEWNRQNSWLVWGISAFHDVMKGLFQEQHTSWQKIPAKISLLASPGNVKNTHWYCHYLLVINRPSLLSSAFISLQILHLVSFPSGSDQWIKHWWSAFEIFRAIASFLEPEKPTGSNSDTLCPPSNQELLGAIKARR